MKHKQVCTSSVLVNVTLLDKASIHHGMTAGHA